MYLRLSVTDRCNLRCRYCRPADAAAPSTPAASDAEVLDLVARIDAVRPLRKLRLTGGEPLVRPGIANLAAALGRLLPDAALGLTTNAAHLPRLAAQLKAAGLARLNISLDTLDPAGFEELSGGRLADTLAGIEAARRANFAIKLNCVLIERYNGRQLHRLAQQAADWGVEIRFIELMPLGPGAELFGTDYLAAADARARLEAHFPHLGPLEATSTARRHLFRVGGRPQPIGFISAVSHPFCDRCDRLRLDCRGRLVSCLRASASVDLLAPLRQGRAEVVDERIAAAVASKRLPGTTWPARQMILIGG